MADPDSPNFDDEPFPTPEWPPIQSPEKIDITGRLHDGGVALVIVASQPIDDSAETLTMIRHKVGTYLTAIDLEDFQEELGHPPRDKTVIVVACEFPIHPTALAVLGQCRTIAAQRGIRLEVQKKLGAEPMPLPDDAPDMLDSVRPIGDDDQGRIDDHLEDVEELLIARYGEVSLDHSEADLDLFQRLSEDKTLEEVDVDLLESVGVAFGHILAVQTPMEWITIEWLGKRVLALRYPDTTVIIFPGSMIAKRISRGEHVEFRGLLGGLVQQIMQMKDDPEYQG